MLRPYQQSAHDAALNWIRQYVEPCIIEAATGAGKSHVIAAIAETIHKLSNGKHILCLAPSAELVIQNREKYLATGKPASMFSATAGQKCLRHPVVFGTPGTVKNRISRFGDQFALIIVDECDLITPTVKSIIEAIRSSNPNLRVLGLTATPYRMKTGYIYAIDENNKPNSEESCYEPYFAKKVYTILARDLIQQGYLSTPLVGVVGASSYKTDQMELNKRGQFDKKDIDTAYHGHGRKTSAIIADIIGQSKNRSGVIIFAATIQHAKECMASLPPELSAIVTSETSKQDRADTVKKFTSKNIKYLVNVSVFTVGFDASHVDVIGILRLTESSRLLQQMIGRGLRQDDNKENCLILDYAGNIERHTPDGDIFNSKIKASHKDTSGLPLPVICPQCDVENEFTARPNLDRLNIDKHGYFLDLDGNKIETDYGAMPAHFGRRCMALLPVNNELRRCTYRWTFKECPHCLHDNDIAARYCKSCKGEIIDPNEKLKIEFKQLKRDPKRVQVDTVLDMCSQTTMSRTGHECLRVDFTTEYRTFAVWYRKDKHDYNLFMAETNNRQTSPKTVTYVKDMATKFYSVLAFNQPPDEDLSV